MRQLRHTFPRSLSSPVASVNNLSLPSQAFNPVAESYSHANSKIQSTAKFFIQSSRLSRSSPRSSLSATAPSITTRVSRPWRSSTPSTLPSRSRLSRGRGRRRHALPPVAHRRRDLRARPAQADDPVRGLCTATMTERAIRCPSRWARPCLSRARRCSMSSCASCRA